MMNREPSVVGRGLVRLPQQAKNFIMVGADAIVLPLALWSALALRLGTLSFDPHRAFRRRRLSSTVCCPRATRSWPG